MLRFFAISPVWSFRRFLITALFIGCFIGVTPKYARATPIVGGTLSEDAVWTPAGSPYEVSGTVKVGGGTTLTVEAGVVVKFAQNIKIEVLNGGSLLVAGSSAAPVIFTDIRDDTAGGDTNGNNTQPVAGSWGGIVVNDGGNAALQYAHVRYATEGVLKEGSGLLAMDDCIITDSLNDGLFLSFTSGANTISRCTFSENTQGIWIWGPSGNVIVDGCTVSANTYYGMSIWDTIGSVSLNKCTVFANSDRGIDIWDLSSGSTMVGLTVPLAVGVWVDDSTVSSNLGLGIAINNSSPFISNSTITGNTIGIQCQGGANPLIGGSLDKRNNIYKNTTFGVENQSPGVVIDATHNWWGDYFGPTHPSNPDGKGDTVSDNVNFSDFARISALTGDLNNDNGIGLEDVIVGLQVMTGITPAIFHPEYAIAGIDVNGDGLAGLAEAIYDLRSVAGFNE